MKYTVLDWLMPVICVGNAIFYGIDVVGGKYITISLFAMLLSLNSIYFSMHMRGKR